LSELLAAPKSKGRRRAGFIVLMLVAWLAVRLAGQSASVSTARGVLSVRAPGFTFIEGAVLDRLRAGRSVRVDLDFAVLSKPQGPTVTETRQSFTLSFDLWEERFAVTLVGTPSRSASHRTSALAETWCLEQLAVPLTALGRYGRDAPFWIRLASHVLDAAPAADADDGGGFTLQTLIDRLSRRHRDDELKKSMEAGPFRVTD
jgi:hypothetical protein